MQLSVCAPTRLHTPTRTHPIVDERVRAKRTAPAGGRAPDGRRSIALDELSTSSRRSWAAGCRRWCGRRPGDRRDDEPIHTLARRIAGLHVALPVVERHAAVRDPLAAVRTGERVRARRVTPGPAITCAPAAAVTGGHAVRQAPGAGRGVRGVPAVGVQGPAVGADEDGPEGPVGRGTDGGGAGGGGRGCGAWRPGGAARLRCRRREGGLRPRGDPAENGCGT